jgi:phosphoribosylaminoimidazole-succinocarboxamide synthase
MNDPRSSGADASARPDIGAAAATVFETNLPGLTPLHRGKVRDLYVVDADRMLIVTTDRLSAFDVVLPDPIPGKGRVLNLISLFWFARTSHIIPNHLTGLPLSAAISDPEQRGVLEGRAVIVRRLRPLPIEAVVRGYLAGSGWKDYQATGNICGIRLPSGLAQAQALPEPIFTPATKAAAGEHDQNIGFEAVEQLLGASLAAQVRAKTLELYRLACSHAQARGIIIADTKFEFGLDPQGQLVLIDEALTPDSSRFWPADSYRVGISPPSFDKQYVRDYLEELHWNKRPPAPHLPADVIQRTAAKYHELLSRMTAPST